MKRVLIPLLIVSTMLFTSSCGNRQGGEIPDETQIEAQDSVIQDRELFPIQDRNGKWGYIDRAGNIAIQPQYDYAYDFYGGYAFVENYSEGGGSIVMDRNGNETDKMREEVAKPEKEYTDGYEIIEREDAYHQTLYSVEDKDGNEIIPPEYDYIHRESDYIFAAAKYTGEIPRFVSALFDTEGNQLTDFIYYNVQGRDEYIMVTDGEYTYYLDAYGKPVDGFPKLEGMGSITLTGDLWRIEIDGDMRYEDSVGNIIWSNAATETTLGDIALTDIVYKPNMNTYAHYPEIIDPQGRYAAEEINETLKGIVIDSAGWYVESEDVSESEYWKHRDYSGDYSANRIGDMLMIEFSGYIYTGGAHGMPFLDTLHFDLISGEIFELGDLFVEGSDYENALIDIMWNEIETDRVTKGEREQKVNDFVDKSYLKCDNFRLKDGHIEIYHTPYALASFADGFVQFDISYDKLDGIIDKEGTLYKRMRGEQI